MAAAVGATAEEVNMVLKSYDYYNQTNTWLQLRQAGASPSPPPRLTHMSSRQAVAKDAGGIHLVDASEPPADEPADARHAPGHATHAEAADEAPLGQEQMSRAMPSASVTPSPVINN